MGHTKQPNLAVFLLGQGIGDVYELKCKEAYDTRRVS